MPPTPAPSAANEEPVEIKVNIVMTSDSSITDDQKTKLEAATAAQIGVTKGRRRLTPTTLTGAVYSGYKFTQVTNSGNGGPSYDWTQVFTVVGSPRDSGFQSGDAMATFIQDSFDSPTYVQAVQTDLGLPSLPVVTSVQAVDEGPVSSGRGGKHKSNSLSAGGIAGIVIAVVLFTATLGFLMFRRAKNPDGSIFNCYRVKVNESDYTTLRNEDRSVFDTIRASLGMGGANYGQRLASEQDVEHSTGYPTSMTGGR